MKNLKSDRKVSLTFTILLMILLLGGCSGLRGSDSGVPGTGSGGPGALYHEFSDVLIPGELTATPKSSYLIQSNGFTAGVLSFKGRVDRGSLIAFFRENMAKDNWKPIASFTSSRSILLFQKDSRWCVINITDGDFSINVEVGVVPTSESPDGLMK